MTKFLRVVELVTFTVLSSHLPGTVTCAILTSLHREEVSPLRLWDFESHMDLNRKGHNESTFSGYFALLQTLTRLPLDNLPTGLCEHSADQLVAAIVMPTSAASESKEWLLSI
jgi:hypothetical protein